MSAVDVRYESRSASGSDHKHGHYDLHQLQWTYLSHSAAGRELIWGGRGSKVVEEVEERVGRQWIGLGEEDIRGRGSKGMLLKLTLIHAY